MALAFVKPTLNSSCFTNNVRELTNIKFSDYNVIVQSPRAEWLYKIKTLFKYSLLKGERDKKIEWQDGLWFEENEYNGLWFEWMNDTMTKAEAMRGWKMMSWWNLSVMKSMAKQRDDQNPNLQSVFFLGH